MPYFEFIGEDASRKSEHAEKFWEITQVGKKVTVRFGKIGADGQLKVKEFETKEEAEADVAKLIKEKTKKAISKNQTLMPKTDGPTFLVRISCEGFIGDNYEAR